MIISFILTPVRGALIIAFRTNTLYIKKTEMAIKNFIRKSISLVLAGLMAASMCACSANNSKSGKLSIVTTIFPEYDWAKEIAGEKISDIDMTLLLDNGVDMHSFQPTAQDIIKISSCDVFVYVGGESDEWVEDVLREAVNKNMQVVNLMEILGDKAVEEEIIEGMQSEDAFEDNKETEYDEHVWLSLRNAQVFVTGIADAMAKADPGNAPTYTSNAQSYNKALEQLDSRYKDAVANGGKDTLLFADRFPFRYLVDDYDLNYFAAFAGCSAETEASFDTVIFLANEINDLCLDYVLIIDNSDQKIAQTVIDNTETNTQKILIMDSMQSATSSDSANGITYVSLMEKNLDVLTEALR